MCFIETKIEHMRRFYMFYSLRYYKIQIVWTGRQSIGLLIAEKVILSRLLAVQIVVDLRFLQFSIYKILNISLISDPQILNVLNGPNTNI